ncbi:MAG: two-component hybrid sensor and regulator, partial [Armatimonadetes bacterium]|nr:two-component hybrid sensor and regulator [Armatimonadota bacterium]
MSAASGPNQSPRARLTHMHHELRTPLEAILGYSETLLRETAARGRDQLLPDLERISAAGVRLQVLVAELLEPNHLVASLNGPELETFRSTLRHELRTPLNHILGYCEILQEDATDLGWDDVIPALERIHGSGRDLLALIDQLLVFIENRELPDAGSRPASFAVSVLSALHPSGETRVAGSGQVLVVDDNEGNRDLLTRWLTREGYAVTAVEDGLRALAHLRDKPCDLVLLDVMMPALNGFEVLQRLKADEKLRHLPVVMVSALAEIDSVVRCIALGAEDYLTKPFNPVLLRARVGACMEKKRLRDRELCYIQQIEREKQRADELLHVIFPRQIVEELKSTYTVKPQVHENVAVLFCDVVGFTPYCERSDPEEVIANLQQLIEAYEELVLRHDMQKIKTFGDSFMATAGLL